MKSGVSRRRNSIVSRALCATLSFCKVVWRRYLGEVGKFNRTVWVIYPRHCTPITIKIGQHLLKLCTKVFWCVFYAPQCTVHRINLLNFPWNNPNQKQDGHQLPPYSLPYLTLSSGRVHKAHQRWGLNLGPMRNPDRPHSQRNLLRGFCKPQENCPVDTVKCVQWERVITEDRSSE